MRKDAKKVSNCTVTLKTEVPKIGVLCFYSFHPAHHLSADLVFYSFAVLKGLTVTLVLKTSEKRGWGPL